MRHEWIKPSNPHRSIVLAVPCPFHPCPYSSHPCSGYPSPYFPYPYPTCHRPYSSNPRPRDRPSQRSHHHHQHDPTCPLLYPNRRPYTYGTVRQDNDLASAPASAFLHRLPHHCRRLENLARRRPCPWVSCPCPYPPAYPWGMQQFPVQASPYPSPGPYPYPCRRPYPYPYLRLHRRRVDGD